MPRTVETNSTKMRLAHYVIGNKADSPVEQASNTASLVAMVKGVLNAVSSGGSGTTGNRFYVDSGAAGASDVAGGGLDASAPFATIDFAVGECTANNGDIVFVMPGHVETKAATGSLLALDVVGVSVIGLGYGASRPTLTLSHTGASMTISAASVTLQNILIVAGVDSVTAPLTISAADCTLRQVEWRDTTDIEFVRGFITTAAADRLVVEDCIYQGYTGGNANVNFARLVGTDNAVFRRCIMLGKVTTAVIEFLTTACTNIVVEDCIFLVTDTTDLTKTVVDTATGSTWLVRDSFDLAAGAGFSGGSGAALAVDDVSTVASVLGAKADAAVSTVGTTASLVAYVKGLLGANNEPVTATGEMDIDISEAVYTGFVTALTIAPATGSPLSECVVDLDLDKATTGAHAVGTAADTLDIAVVSKVDGTNLRRLLGAGQITISDTPSASDNGVRLNIGLVGDTETVEVQVKVSAERADVEIPYAVSYRASAAPTITAVAAV